MTVKNKGISVEAIYETLENEIVSLHIKPAEILSENSLCQRFEVSRTPIRSALQRLEQNRFVDILPQRGTVVTKINMDIVNQLIYSRVALETMIFRDFVVSASPTDIAKCKFAYEELLKKGEIIKKDGETHENIDAFLQKDLEMHKVWYDATGKPYLWGSLTRPQADYSRFIRLDILGAKNAPDVIIEHGEFIRIIDEKDYDAIEPLLKKHLYGGIRRLGSQLFSEKFKNYFIEM